MQIIDVLNEASTASPAATPRSPVPGDQVFYAAVPATLTRIYSVGDPDTEVDLAIYPGGQAQFLKQVRHDVAQGWAWPSEVQAQREAELIESAEGRVLRAGMWVRFAHVSRTSGSERAQLQLVRGKVLSFDKVKVNRPDEPDDRVTLELYPLDFPADPTEPDEPLGVPHVQATHVDLKNISAVEMGQPGRFEFLGESHLYPIPESHYGSGSLVDCPFCERRVAHLAGKISIDSMVEPRGKREYTVCRSCLSGCRDGIADTLAARDVAMRKRRIVGPFDPRTIKIPGVLLLDEHEPSERVVVDGEIKLIGASEEDLRAMADQSNASADQGQPTPVVLDRSGLTVGYASNLTVAAIPGLSSFGLIADLEIKRVHLQEAANSPRVSISRVGRNLRTIKHIVLLPGDPPRVSLPPVDFKQALRLL